MGVIARTDIELVEASRRGERDAFGRLVARYQDVVWAVSFSSTGDRALGEDVAQETFIAAWRQLDQLRDTVRIRPWLCGIARNLAKRARARTRRETSHDAARVLDDVARTEAAFAETAFANTASPFERIAQAESDQVVRDALARVPDGYREVLVLYYRENRSVKDVAAALDISEQAVMQRLTRGRRYLADGVTKLVEDSLRGARPRRDLVAGVVAAIAGLSISSRVDASPAKGSTMLKVAIASVVLAAAGGTVALVAKTKTTADAAGPQASGFRLQAQNQAASPTVALAAASLATPPQVAAKVTGGSAEGEHCENKTPDPDDTPTITKDQIDKLGLYKGPSRGPATAPVTIVLFQDNMCQFCGKVLGTIDQLMDEYPGKLRLVVKQFPVHDLAKLSAEASYAADAQGKFWELHDLMFAHQDDLSRDALITYATQAGMDTAKFTAALDHHDYAPAVAEDVSEGKGVDVMGTPAFLINGRRFAGARPIEDFRTAIDSALAD